MSTKGSFNLRYGADARSVLWLLLTTLLFGFLWLKGEQLWMESKVMLILIYLIYLYFSIAVSVIIHNHTHLGIWKSKTLNSITNIWLTVFYGFPIFGWIPTHHKNHHVHGNKDEDYTKTYMFSEKNNLWTVLAYPSRSAAAQQKPIFTFLIQQYKERKPQFRHFVLQCIVLVIWIGAFMFLDWKKAILLVIIPQQVSMNTVLVFNYWQHVHADEESKYNSSRNFTGKLTNFMLFNNGFHMAHHLQPALHWSLLGNEHKKIAQFIAPELNEQSIFTYLIKRYIIGIVYEPFRTKSMRLERMRNELNS